MVSCHNDKRTTISGRLPWAARTTSSPEGANHGYYVNQQIKNFDPERDRWCACGCGLTTGALKNADGTPRMLRIGHRLSFTVPQFSQQPACEGMDSEVFFGPETEPGMPPDMLAISKQIFEAKKVCWRCPVRAECLRFALRNGESSGVWGGLGPGERRTAVKLDGAALEAYEAVSEEKFYAKLRSEEIKERQAPLNETLKEAS